MKDIKTKDIVKDIKAIDKVAIAGERIRNTTMKTKEHIEESSESQYATPHDYASSKITSQVEHFTNKTAVESKIQSQKIVHLAKERKRKATYKSVVKDDVKSEKEVSKDTIESKTKIKTKEPIEREIKATDRNSKKMLKSVDNKSIKIAEKSGKVAKKTEKVSIKTTQEVAKQAAIKSVKTSKQAKHIAKEVGRKSIATVKNTAKAVKRVIDATRTAIAILCSVGWIAILVILLIALVGGLFMTGSSSSGEGNQLSSEVIAHTATIQKYADEYEIPHFVNAIQAIMMQESGGRGNDPMQASECAYNTKYPNIPNGITDAEYSIQVGIQNFAYSLKQANCKDPLDIPTLSLALQGYNFGNGYIGWALENFGAYSQGNAKVFADDQARSHGWSSYGDPEYVSHVMRYYQFASLGTSNSKLVNIATSQLGNVGGAPYWSWYGYSARVEWCACFVSWCADQSGDLGISIPKFAAVVEGVKWYKERSQWQDRNYIPQTGTIIFFDWENDGTPDHVGIVEKVENGSIYTIEGNSNDECKRNRYNIGEILIYGFGLKNVDSK